MLSCFENHGSSTENGLRGKFERDIPRQPFMHTPPSASASIIWNTNAGPLPLKPVTASIIDSATITWDTNEPSNSLVKYGTESGNCTSQKYDSENVTSHSIALTGLLSNTTYYFVVNSTDQSGNSNQSAEHNFTTSIKGDLNGDGNLTSADVVIALQIAVSGEYVPEADIDENGYVNALDARMIMQAAAGAIDL
jgi:hypothetical protein